MKIRYIDLFCGIGGFRLGATNSFSKFGFEGEAVFSSDIDLHARKMYFENFGDYPYGDITKIRSSEIPNHDILFAGFPCQPFSIIGDRKGFEDTRGTLFFEIARILEDKGPRAFVLENVKQLVSHRNGYTFQRILETLREIGYYVEYRVLNALDYGLPQKRERVFIVGYFEPFKFIWPKKNNDVVPLSEILEQDVPEKYYASEEIQKKRSEKHQSKKSPSIWHENKGGNVNSHPFSCALRAGASYNYLLVDGKRRLTPREMLRLQGFPDSYKIFVSDTQLRKQAGNAVPVPVVEAVLDSFMPIITSRMKPSINFPKVYNDGRKSPKIPQATNSR